MVVLEEGSMLTTGHNQYLQPDYLSPLPVTLDAKKSPLALLAQTCSQIGSDSPTKPLISSLEKSSKGSSNARSPPAAKLERTRSSPSDGSVNGSKSNGSSISSSSSAGLAFKPYETNVVSKPRSSDEMSRPASKASSVHSVSGVAESANNSVNSNGSEPTSFESNLPHKKRSTPHGRKSASPATNQHTASATNTTTTSSSSSSSSPNGVDRKTPADREKTSASPRHNSGASPIIRTGMEILSGHSSAAKDAAAAAASLQSMYKAGALPFGAASSLCCPPGLAENPAFRPPFGGASPFSHHHAAAAAALLGYPSAAGSPTNNPYMNYARIKTPSGGESLISMCKDPYCTGCQYNMHNAQMMMAAAAAAGGGAAGQSCPSGCTQCDHQKYGLMALSSLAGPMPPPSLAGYQSSLAAAAAAANGRLHVCNWAVDNSYCGKRFSSSDELLQHLRTHTSTDPAVAAALLASQHAHPLLSPSAALHRAAAAGSYPAPSLSPLSARYHPYGKPPSAGPLPASLAASPYSAFNALGPYYSPYAIYGQRIGAAVHP